MRCKRAGTDTKISTTRVGVRGVAQLTHLDLQNCKGLTGNLVPLQGLTKLTHLKLCKCNKLIGHLRPLHGLTQLTDLDLNDCEGLFGDLGPLEMKRHLMHSRLRR